MTEATTERPWAEAPAESVVPRRDMKVMNNEKTPWLVNAGVPSRLRGAVGRIAGGTIESERLTNESTRRALGLDHGDT